MTLKEFRTAQSLTQDQLAEKLGVSRQSICNWEARRMAFSNRSKRDLKAIGYDVDGQGEK